MDVIDNEASLIVWFRQQSNQHEKMLEELAIDDPTPHDIRVLKALHAEDEMGALDHYISTNPAFLEKRPAISDKARTLVDLLQSKTRTFYDNARHDVQLYASLAGRISDETLLAEHEHAATAAIERMQLFDEKEASHLQRVYDTVSFATRSAHKTKISQAEDAHFNSLRGEKIRKHYEAILERFHSHKATTRASKARSYLKDLRTDILDLAEEAKVIDSPLRTSINNTLEEIDERYEKASRHYFRRAFTKFMIGVSVITASGVSYFFVKRAAVHYKNYRRGVRIEQTVTENERLKEERKRLLGAYQQTNETLEDTRNQKSQLEEELAQLRTTQTTAPTTRTTALAPATPTKEKLLLHIVGRGESLSGIRQQYYGDNDWHALLASNNGMVNDERNWLYPGQVLVMDEQGLTTRTGLYELEFTADAIQEYREAHRVPVPLFEVTHDGTSYEQIARELGKPGAGQQIRDAWGGVNHRLARLRKGDFVHIPKSLATGHEQLYGGDP